MSFFGSRADRAMLPARIMMITPSEMNDSMVALMPMMCSKSVSVKACSDSLTMIFAPTNSRMSASP